MKRKKLLFLSLLVGAAALVVAGKMYADAQEDARFAEDIEAVRAYFSQLGEIAMVYVDQTASTLTCTTGGVGMTDGRLFLFDYEDDELVYEESQA